MRWRLAAALAALVAVVAAGVAMRSVTSTPAGPPLPVGTASALPPVTSPSPSSAGGPSGQPETSRPESSTTSSPLRRSPETGLKGNSLYQLDLAEGAGRCEIKVRKPRPPLPNAQLGPYLSSVATCLAGVFRGPLAEIGFPLATPKVKTYRKAITTPCGQLGSRLAPAYYCDASATIYWPTTSDDGDQAYTFARLGYVALLAHEFGHHLQATSGMFRTFSERYYRASRSERYVLSRRLELQASCFEGVFLSYASGSLGLSRRDRQELLAWHSHTGDEDPPKGRKPDHGTSKAQIYWLRRGLEHSDFGRCNTWSAAKKKVT